MFSHNFLEKDNARIETQFEMADHLYAHAVVEAPKTVCLWLGVFFTIFSWKDLLD